MRKEKKSMLFHYWKHHAQEGFLPPWPPRCCDSGAEVGVGAGCPKRTWLTPRESQEGAYQPPRSHVFIPCQASGTQITPLTADLYISKLDVNLESWAGHLVEVWSLWEEEAFIGSEPERFGQQPSMPISPEYMHVQRLLWRRRDASAASSVMFCQRPSRAHALRCLPTLAQVRSGALALCVSVEPESLGRRKDRPPHLREEEGKSDPWADPLANRIWCLWAPRTPSVKWQNQPPLLGGRSLTLPFRALIRCYQRAL